MLVLVLLSLVFVVAVGEWVIFRVRFLVVSVEYYIRIVFVFNFLNVLLFYSIVFGAIKEGIRVFAFGREVRGCSCI